MLPTASLTGYVFTVLYLMGQLWAVIGTLPVLIRGQVALEEIERLGLGFEPVEEATATDAEDEIPGIEPEVDRT
jgi:ABC-type siderophore export system fused ATPase/permease subunit